MSRSHLSLVVALGIFLCGRATAQTVQLPTFNVFSVATTVVIPDRGSTYLGGVNRARYDSSTRGVPGLSHLPGAGRLFTNRGIGSEVSTSGVSAGATIMDLGELDRSVLSEAASRRGDRSGSGGAAGNPAIEKKAAFIAKHVAKTDRSRIAPRPQLTQRQK